MRRTLAKASFHTALNLAVFALIGTAILAFTYAQTHDRIAQSEEAEKLKLISQIVPHDLFDNDIIKDTLDVKPDALLGNEDTTTAYRARLQDKPSVLVLEAVAPDGYSGKIALLIAIRDNGELAGVRVVAHKETPGLGDYIDISRSNWIKGFDGTSLEKYNGHARSPLPNLPPCPQGASPPGTRCNAATLARQAGEGANESLRDLSFNDRDWKVKKDGGQFDYMAGATITPRAVVKAVHKALQFFAQNHDALFAQTAPATKPAKDKKP
ncbi:MAG: RnfABCDGE type electron transport complex subunit G [Proteobacteria bacterium]|nr:RnfABCDGE type electron transport complex subunit G [Pseudomonadota bacterium]